MRSSRAEKRQRKLSDVLADTREILGRTRTELHSMEELTEILYIIAQKLPSIVDYLVIERKSGAGGSESVSFDILFHCALKDLETQSVSQGKADEDSQSVVSLAEAN